MLQKKVLFKSVLKNQVVMLKTACLAMLLNINTSFAVEIYNYNQLNTAITEKEAFLNIDTNIIIRGVVSNITSNIRINGNRYSLFGQSVYHGFSIASGIDAYFDQIKMYDFKSAIFDNNGNTTIYESDFYNNVSESRGGGVQNSSGSLKIYNSNLFYNQLTSVSAENSGGGAVYNAADLEMHYTQVIGNSINNSAENSGGGGLFNAFGATASLYGVMLQNNQINSDIDYKKGGSIYNQGSMYIYNSGFLDNILTGDGENIAGGAIYNQSGVISMDNIYFYNNKANYGGAIYNEAAGNINIYNSSFIANFAETAGSAIYNKGIVSIIADDGIIRFYVNSTNSGIDDAIYNVATLNLNAGSNTGRDGVHSSFGFIDFRDDIVGDGNGEVNINKSISSLSYQYSNVSSPVSGSVFFTGTIFDNDLNMYSGNLSFANGEIKEHFSGEAFSQSGGSIWLDVDLEKGLIDTIDANVVSGTPNFSFLRILEDIDADITLDVFTNASAGSMASFNTYTNNSRYYVTYNADGSLTFDYNYLANAFDAAGRALGNKSFSLTSDLKLASSTINSGNFTIYSNLKDAKNYTIDAAGNVDLAADNFKYGTDLYGISGEGTYSLLRSTTGIINIVDLVVRDCVINDGFGAVIAHVSAQINIYNSVFVNNHIIGSRSYNGGVLSTDYSTNTFYSAFVNNSATSRGGAFSNGRNTMAIYMATFDSNEANQGGAIATRGYLVLSESEILNNTARDSGGGLYLYIQSGTPGDATVDATTFKNNTAGLYGGAIYNMVGATLLITDSQFSDNSAKTGGAIYNAGTTSIASSSVSSLFSGNTATSDVDADGDGQNDKYYNAIYNTGTLNLNAGLLHTVTFDDAIEGSNGVININNITSLGDVVEGKIVFNNEISGNTVNFYNGTLQFGYTTLDGTTYMGSFASATNFNIYGGRLSLIDNDVRSVSLGNMTLHADMEYAIDVDLALETSDTISTTSFNANGNTILLKEINILTDAVGLDAQVLLSDNVNVQTAIELDINRLITRMANVENTYNVTYTKSTGILDFGKLNFKETVNSPSDSKLYAFNENEIADQTIGSLGGSVLGVIGKDFELIANSGVDGIIMSGGQEFHMIDISEVSGFDNYFIQAERNDMINIYASDTKTTTLNSAIIGGANINININPANTGSVVFNKETSADDISIDNGSAIFNAGVNANIINSGTTTLNNLNVSGSISGDGNYITTGDVVVSGASEVFNVTNSGTLTFSDDLTLNNGFNGGQLLLAAGKTLKLVGDNADISGAFLKMESGTINTIGDGINNYSLGNVELNNTNLEIDINLNLPSGVAVSDTFLASGTGNLTLSDINLLDVVPTDNVTGKTGSLDIITNNETISIDGIDVKIFSNEYTIYFTTDAVDKNTLNYALIKASNDLQSTIASLDSPRQYIMVVAESAGTSTLKGEMTIKGNGNTISDGDITILENSSLTLENVDVKANIASSSANSVVNFNEKVDFSGTMSGVVANVNEDFSRAGQDSNVSYNISSGKTLSYSKDAFLDGNNSLTFEQGSGLNMINNLASTVNIDKFMLNGDANLHLDVDLEKKLMDSFNIANFDPDSYKLNISGLNVITNGADAKTSVVFTTNLAIAQAVENNVSSIDAKSPIFAYDVLYSVDLTTNEGIFTFSKKQGDAGFVPEVQTEGVSSQSIYSTNVDFSKQMLAALDAYSPIQGRSTGDTLPEISGAWVKVYGSNEDISLGSLDVENQTYAGILGVDGATKYYDNGINGKYSLYMAYISAEQQYSGVNISQDGINIGARAMYDKGNWFGGVVAGLGFNLVEGTSSAGVENFETYTAALSLKTGYDLNLYCAEYILQPNITLSYLYAHTPDYKNASNVEIKSDDLHALNINPEIKFVAHKSSGYSNYVSVGYNVSVEAGGSVSADNVSLPELSVDPYAEYKVGITKEASNGISGYAEVFATTGGREGYGAQFGLKWNF